MTTEPLVDIGFVVSINEVPAHLAEAVRARLGLELQALMSEPFSQLEDLLELDDNRLSDEDFNTIRHLGGHASQI